MTMLRDDEFEQRVAALEEKAQLREDGPPDAAIIERQSRGIFLWEDVRALFERIHDPFLDAIWTRALAVHFLRTSDERITPRFGPVSGACDVLSYMPAEKAPASLREDVELLKLSAQGAGEDSRDPMLPRYRTRAALVWLLFERHGFRRLHELVIEMVQQAERREKLIAPTHLTDQQRERLLALVDPVVVDFDVPLLAWRDSAGEVYTSASYRLGTSISSVDTDWAGRVR